MICAKMTPNPTDLPKSYYPSYMKQMLGLHYTESPHLHHNLQPAAQVTLDDCWLLLCRHLLQRYAAAGVQAVQSNPATRFAQIPPASD